MTPSRASREARGRRDHAATRGGEAVSDASQHTLGPLPGQGGPSRDCASGRAAGSPDACAAAPAEGYSRPLQDVDVRRGRDPGQRPLAGGRHRQLAGDGRAAGVGRRRVGRAGRGRARREGPARPVVAPGVGDPRMAAVVGRGGAQGRARPGRRWWWDWPRPSPSPCARPRSRSGRHCALEETQGACPLTGDGHGERSASRAPPVRFPGPCRSGWRPWRWARRSRPPRCRSTRRSGPCGPALSVAVALRVVLPPEASVVAPAEAVTVTAWAVAGPSVTVTLALARDGGGDPDAGHGDGQGARHRRAAGVPGRRVGRVGRPWHWARRSRPPRCRSRRR